ncbi:MAG: rhodanese-like domain-containing protein [Mariprofundales bacterium]|nr:rhodanese-like domain-containing protein [Mariprofundales bacterium]
MRRVFLFTLLLCLPIIASACGTGEVTPQGYENVTITHAHNHWKQGESSPIPFLFLDVRTPKEYAAGHVPRAKLLPIQSLADHLKEVPHDRQVYVYCHSGTRSTKASILLAKHGFTNIENVVGGIVAWKRSGFEVVK